MTQIIYANENFNNLVISKYHYYFMVNSTGLDEFKENFEKLVLDNKL